MTKLILLTGDRYLVRDSKEKRLSIFQGVSQWIENQYKADGDVVFVSFLAEGFDEAVAKACQDLEIPYTIMLPNTGYGLHYWKNNSLLGRDRYDRFEELLVSAKGVSYACGRSVRVQGEHSNFIRNRIAVSLIDFAILFRPETSGTKDVVRKLNQASKPARIMDENGEVGPLLQPIPEIISK